MAESDQRIDASDVGRIRRRELLITGAAAGAAVTLPLNHAAIARGRRVPFVSGGKFEAGVSSGFPSPQAITLWTRLSELDRTSKLTIEVARDKGFRHVIESRTVQAQSKRDYSVHTRVKGLKPDHEYFYRFHTRGKNSPVGVFRTAPPPGSQRPIRIGFYSCQSYEAGYYTAQRALANEPDLDLIICLGDYIYETHFYDGPADRKDTTGLNHDGDVQTLPEYRDKYRLVQADPNLRAMHQSAAFLAITDDHEVEDNYAGSGPDPANSGPDKTKFGSGEIDRRVPFAKRQANGYQAFFDAMPRQRIRKDKRRTFGSVPLGGLAELFLIDDRQYRDPQACGDAIGTPCPEDDAPGRTLLGVPQKDWLKNALNTSPAKWKVLASQVMMMSLDSATGAHLNPDQWDGYSSERAEILNSFVDSGGKDLVVITGDIHTFFAGKLTTNGNTTGRPAGVELVGSSATSQGLDKILGIPGPLTGAASLFQANNPHFDYINIKDRGYGVLTIGPDETIAELKMVDAFTPQSTPTTLVKYRIAAGTPALERI